MSPRAAFLDRDGTLNVRPPAHCYVESPGAFTWLPGAVAGAATLARAGFVLVVVSNQRGISRGVVTAATLREIEDEIQARLADHNCMIASFRYCPHEIDARCRCRKPQPGMLISAARELDLDLERSWMIGDSKTDVQAGRAAGCHTALIGSDGDSAGSEVSAPTLLEVSRRLATSEQPMEV